MRRCWRSYGPLYWRMVLENRDAALYPPASLYLLPAENAVVGPDTMPTHGYYRWQYGPVWLAPPDREIAEVSFSLQNDDSGSGKALRGNVAIDFQCMGYSSILMKQPQVKPDGAWHTLKLDPGIRALRSHAFTSRWQMKFSSVHGRAGQDPRGRQLPGELHAGSGRHVASMASRTVATGRE